MTIRGAVTLGEMGRPQVVYGQRCSHETLAHEVWVTEAEILMGIPFARRVRVGEAIADGCFDREGHRFWVEVDNETMSDKLMREKWNRYGIVTGFILVVCRTRSRLRQLIASAESVQQVALFTRFRWLGSDSIREPWIDWTGHRAAI